MLPANFEEIVSLTWKTMKSAVIWNLNDTANIAPVFMVLISIIFRALYLHPRWLFGISEPSTVPFGSRSTHDIWSIFAGAPPLLDRTGGTWLTGSDGDGARQDRQRQEFPGTFPGNEGFNIMAMRNIIQSGKHAKLQITCGDELQTSNCKEVFIQCWMRSHLVV